MAVTSLHLYRIVRHQVVPESAGFGLARSRGCPGEGGRGAGAGGAGMRPANALFVPTEVTLPCAMLAALALTSSPRLPALFHIALSLTDCFWRLIFSPHQYLIFIFKSSLKKPPLTPPAFSSVYVSLHY